MIRALLLAAGLALATPTAPSASEPPATAAGLMFRGSHVALRVADLQQSVAPSARECQSEEPTPILAG